MIVVQNNQIAFDLQLGIESEDVALWSLLLAVLRHKIYYTHFKHSDMEKEHYPTRESSQTNLWSQERQVYYYSNFDLFDCETAEQEFYQFSTFIQKVASELGTEWQRQAQSLYHPFLHASRVFMTLMQLWLSQHPTTSTLGSNKTKITPFNPSFMAKFHQRAQEEIFSKDTAAIVQPPSTALKAVCLGFYMTANEAWQDLFQTQQTRKLQPFSNSLLREVKTTIHQTFKPLMVISEKISSVFGRKKRKFNEEVEPDETDSNKFNNCYHEFRKTMDIEKELERKMSDLDINTEEQAVSKGKKMIEKKKFQEEEAPIKGSLLGNVYGYVTGFLQRNSSWQVASSFVTQILEMNQVRLEEGKKVKVMRPAQDFYRKLVMVWLMLQKREHLNPTFAQFLHCLQTAFFSERWHDRYLIPTKYFFERMCEEWQLAHKEGPKNEKEVLKAFLKRVRLGMKNQWDHKIKLNPSIVTSSTE